MEYMDVIEAHQHSQDDPAVCTCGQGGLGDPELHRRHVVAELLESGVVARPAPNRATSTFPAVQGGRSEY